MIIKIIIGDIQRFKLRTGAIITCIAVSIALLYASATTFQMLLKAYEDSNKITVGNSDFMIHSGKVVYNSGFFIQDIPDNLEEQLAYVFDVPEAYGNYHTGSNDFQLRIRGLEQEEMEKMGTYHLQSDDGTEFCGNKVYLNAEFRKKYGYSIGDTIELEIMEQVHCFTVSGIFEAQSMFSAKACENQVMVPKLFLKQILHYRGEETNAVYIKCKNSREFNQIKKELQAIYQEETVENSFSQEEFNEKMQGIQIVFIISSILIVIMCLLIVYNIFRVIFSRRLKMLGVLRSLGATKGKVNQMVVLEGLLYGGIGGIAGDMLGMLITFGMLSYLKPDTIANVSFMPKFVFLVISFFFSIAVCMCVSYQAAKSVARMPIKELLFEYAEKKPERRQGIKAFAGVILYIASISLTFLIPQSSSMNLLIGIILISIVSVLCFLLALIRWSIKSLAGVVERFSAHICYLAMQNLKSDENMKRSIMLIAISVGTILMTNSALNSILSSNLETLRNNYRCDYIVKMNQDGEKAVNRIRSIDEVTACILQRYVENVAVCHSTDYEIYNIDGYSSPEYLNFRNFEIDTSLLQNQGERTIILTNSIRIKLGVKRGDSLTLEGVNGKEHSYTVTGFFDSPVNNGSYALIPESFLETDFGSLSRYEIYVDMMDTGTKDKLENALRSYNPTVQSVEEMVNEVFENSKMTFEAIQIISVLPIVVSVIILCSNSVISYYEKKRSMAVYRALGLDRKGAGRMLLVEYLAGGFLSACYGVSIGNILIFQIKTFLGRIGSTMPVQYSFKLSVMIFILVFILFVFPGIWNSVKGIQFKIGDEIKYRE